MPNAIVMTGYGPPEVLKWAGVPLPEPGQGQIRIKVKAAGISPTDLALRAGYLKDIPLPPGAVLGFDDDDPVTRWGWRDVQAEDRCNGVTRDRPGHRQQEQERRLTLAGGTGEADDDPGHCDLIPRVDDGTARKLLVTSSPHESELR